jgi:hypothetical protein
MYGAKSSPYRCQVRDSRWSMPIATLAHRTILIQKAKATHFDVTLRVCLLTKDCGASHSRCRKFRRNVACTLTRAQPLRVGGVFTDASKSLRYLWRTYVMKKFLLRSYPRTLARAPNCAIDKTRGWCALMGMLFIALSSSLAAKPSADAYGYNKENTTTRAAISNDAPWLRNLSMKSANLFVPVRQIGPTLPSCHWEVRWVECGSALPGHPVPMCRELVSCCTYPSGMTNCPAQLNVQ